MNTLTSLSFAFFGLVTTVVNVNAVPYTADYDSLAKHTAAPEWFQDSKLGIYFHWGVYSVPAFGSEWYPFYMNRPQNWISKHHRATYGDPKTHPYHDFVPQFTGEHFDAAEWAQLFADSGARFAGPVAEHHDGFAMWDSEITPWNAMDRGPKQDVLGGLFKELRTHEIRTLATFHHARNLQRYPEVEAPPADSKEFKTHKGRGDSHF